MDINRRDDRRIFLQTFLTEYVEERPCRGVITNVSEHGLRVQRLLRPSRRQSRVVQLEFELPGTNEIIWARGEACFDELEPAPFGPTGGGPAATLHSSGIRVVALARQHARLMHDYVFEKRREQLENMLSEAARRRVH